MGGERWMRGCAPSIPCSFESKDIVGVCSVNLINVFDDRFVVPFPERPRFTLS